MAPSTTYVIVLAPEGHADRPFPASLRLRLVWNLDTERFVLIACQAIEVPETILKKKNQNAKAREERLAAATAARKVS